MTDRDDMTSPAGGLTDGEARPGVQIGGLQEHFAAQFAQAASTMTGRSVSVRPAQWSLQSRSQFLLSVREPTCCCTLLAAGAASPAALIEVGQAVAWVMIDSLLGGADDGAYAPSRALTAVEHRLLGRVAAVAGECLTRVWPVQPAPRFEVSSRVSPQRGPVSSRLGVVLNFVLGVGGPGETMRIFLPEAILGGPPATGAANRSGPVEISVTTAEGEIVLGRDELAGLAPGDILTTDTMADGEVIVRVAGIPKYRARLGACNGRRAVTILGPVDAPAGD